MIYGAVSRLVTICHHNATGAATRPAAGSAGEQCAQQPGRRRAVREQLIVHRALATRARRRELGGQVGHLGVPDVVGRQLGGGEQRAAPLAGRLAVFLVAAAGHEGHRLGLGHAVPVHRTSRMVLMIIARRILTTLCPDVLTEM